MTYAADRKQGLNRLYGRYCKEVNAEFGVVQGQYYYQLPGVEIGQRKQFLFSALRSL